MEFQPLFETPLIVTPAFIISCLQTSIHKREVRKCRIIYIILPRAKTCKLLVEQNMYMYMPLMVICQELNETLYPRMLWDIIALAQFCDWVCTFLFSSPIRVLNVKSNFHRAVVNNKLKNHSIKRGNICEKFRRISKVKFLFTIKPYWP